LNNVGLFEGFAQGDSIQQCFATGKINATSQYNPAVSNTSLFIGKKQQRREGMTAMLLEV